MISKSSIIMCNSYILEKIYTNQRQCILTREIYGYPEDIEELLEILQCIWPLVTFSAYTNKYLIEILVIWPNIYTNSSVKN